MQRTDYRVRARTNRSLLPKLAWTAQLHYERLGRLLDQPMTPRAPASDPIRSSGSVPDFPSRWVDLACVHGLGEPPPGRLAARHGLGRGQDHEVIADTDITKSAVDRCAWVRKESHWSFPAEGTEMDESELRTFDNRVLDASKRLVNLEQRTRTRHTVEDNDTLLFEAVEELRTSLEELQVASEELRAQTEELDAARMLVERERVRYRDLFFALPDAYLVTDHHGVIQEANPQATTLLGLPAITLRGRPLTLHVTASQRRAFRAELATLVQTNSVQRLTLRLRRRDDTESEVAASVRASVRPGEDPELCWTLWEVGLDHEQAEQLRALETEFVQDDVAADQEGGSTADTDVSDYSGGWPQLRVECIPGGLLLVGEADLHTAALLSQALATALHRCDSDLVVDVSRLRFMDAAIAEVLIDAARQMPSRGMLRLVHPQQVVAKVLRLLRLDELATIQVEYNSQIHR
jgi:anti-anti-sigma factor